MAGLVDNSREVPREMVQVQQVTLSSRSSRFYGEIRWERDGQLHMSAHISAWVAAEGRPIMAKLKLELDVDTLERLIERAVQGRRPIVMQAEVLLQSLGLPFS